jgi:hypothetical protein
MQQDADFITADFLYMFIFGMRLIYGGGEGVYWMGVRDLVCIE